MRLTVNVTNYDIETIATITIGDTITGLKFEKDRDTFESVVIKMVEAINQVLENENG